jgi:hypothetical protein
VTNYSEEYQTKIRQEYDEKVSDTDFWREYLNELVRARAFLSRQLETAVMGDIGAVLLHAKLQGDVAGIDRSLRLVLKILDRERVAGISGVAPGF